MYFTMYNSKGPIGSLKDDAVSSVYLAQEADKWYIRASDGTTGHDISPRLSYEQASALYNAYTKYLFGDCIDTLFPELQI